MKLSFALPKQPKPGSSSTKVEPSKRPTVFAAAEDADDDNNSGDAVPSILNGPRTGKKNPLVQAASQPSRTQRKLIEQELKEDKSVYEYDEVYDDMQAARQRQKEAKEAEDGDRKPKHINAFLQSAARRKMDFYQAEEKKYKREREQEGDEFADKEQFVTQAYKDLQVEMRRAEKEEKEQETLARKQRGTTGITHFYAKLLQDSEEQHQAAVAATSSSSSKVVQGPSPNLTIFKPPTLASKTDLELARDAREKGKEVELNDDNQLVDKRELLSAGLNLSAPNTRKLGLSGQRKEGVDPSEAALHRAVGTAASRREINERRMREIETQMKDEEQRMVEKRARQEEEAKARIIARRNNAEEVNEARERYLARKRRKLEEGEALPVSGVTDS